MNNKEIKLDRRTSRTRRQLRNALMDLILERGYNAVTVEDITDRADLGRTTFYLHYRDKERLLIESLEAIAEDLKKQVENVAGFKLITGEIDTNPVAVVFRHVNENRDLYRIILKGEGGSKASSRIREIIEEASTEFFQRHLSNYVSKPSQFPRGLVAGYFAGAMLGFINLWLEKELPYTGDEAADHFMILFFRGAARVLNLSIEV